LSITHLEITVRLVLALILGGLIGLERESMGRPAGLRTHILVTTGSALVMLLSMYAFAGMEGRYDPGRMAAQVVSGIGFLGAGTILREGISVQGLTTAASLWAVAAIGLAVGSGFYYAAVLATALVALTLVFFYRIEWSRLSSRHKILTVIIQDTPGQLANVFVVLAKHKASVLNVDLASEDGGDAKLNLKIELPPKASGIEIVTDLAETPGVKRASYV